MNSLYTLALRQTAAIQADLTALEQSYATPAAATNGSTSGLNGQITASLAALDRTVDDYDNMARREIVELKKEKALSRVARFKDDYASLRKQYDKVKTNGAAVKAAIDRDSLLGGSTSSAISSSTSSGPSSRRPTSQQYPPPPPESPFTINMSSAQNPSQSNPYSGGGGDYESSIHNNSRTNYALRENDFMASTSATLDSYIQQGQAVLGNLGTQRDMLKGTKRRLLSAANTLGLSRTTIQYIERRTKGDFYVLVGGALFTFFCFYLILKYFG